MNRVKVIDFKIHAYYFLDDRINMKNHAKNKNIISPDISYETTNCLKPFYFIINKING